MGGWASVGDDAGVAGTGVSIGGGAVGSPPQANRTTRTAKNIKTSNAAGPTVESLQGVGIMGAILYLRIDVPMNHTTLPKPIPRWDAHLGILKTTESTPRLLISPFGPNWAATGSAV